LSGWENDFARLVWWSSRILFYIYLQIYLKSSVQIVLAPVENSCPLVENSFEIPD